MSSFPSSACVPTALPLTKTTKGNPCTPHSTSRITCPGPCGQLPLHRLGRDRGDGRRHGRSREPPGEQLFELSFRLSSRLREELRGVVFRQVAGEEEQPRQVEITAGELVEHLGEPLDQAGHADTLGRAVPGVPETLGAIGEEGGTRIVQVELSAVELCQVEDDVGARRPLRAHGGREPLAELVIGDRRERVHAFSHITRFFELAADTLSAFRAPERVARRRARERARAGHDARARGHHPRGRRTRARVARNCAKRNRRLDALSFKSPYAETLLARPQTNGRARDALGGL